MATRRSSTPARETKMTSRKSEPQPQAGAQSGGMGFADAILIFSAILLIAAILVTDYHMGHDLATGVFFKK